MKLLHDYCRAYRDCYRWLYRWCPPWRWLLTAIYVGPKVQAELKYLRNLPRMGND